MAYFPVRDFDPGDFACQSCISTAAAKYYAENPSQKGHREDELHGLDYPEYAYLQKGEDILAKERWDSLSGVTASPPGCRS